MVVFSVIVQWVGMAGGWPGMAQAGEVDHAGRFHTYQLDNGRAAGVIHFLKIWHLQILL